MTKEWLRVSHAGSNTFVTCTLVEDNLSVKWTVKAFKPTIQQGVAEARKGAQEALSDLKVVL